MKIRQGDSHFVISAEYKSRELNLQLIDSEVDSRVTYINDDKEVLFFRTGLGIQIPIEEIPLYKDTIVDIYNAVMRCTSKKKYFIDEGLKEEISKEWMTIYELYQWQKLNHIDTFGMVAKPGKGRILGENNG